MPVSLFFSLCMLLLPVPSLINAQATQSDGGKYPVFPLQLSADVEITAHLVAHDSEYPPRVRRMSIHYDYLNKVARADIEEGYEAAKTYIRRYDTNNEYMIRHPPIDDCKRSYLGEVMPFPDIPHSKHMGEEEVDGFLCDHYVHSEHDDVSHIYIEQSTGKPVKLTQSSLSRDINRNPPVEIEVLTYKYLNVAMGPPDSTMFIVPSPFAHESCERYVGGFPYLHIFQYFVRF